VTLYKSYFQQILYRAFNQIAEDSDETAEEKLIDFTNNLVRLTANYLNDKEFEQDQISRQGAAFISCNIYVPFLSI
ncbi:MAG: hypothetical protein ACKOA4_11860, partial [Haliscomenobacter sp.]